MSGKGIQQEVTYHDQAVGLVVSRVETKLGDKPGGAALYMRSQVAEGHVELGEGKRRTGVTVDMLISGQALLVEVEERPRDPHQYLVKTEAIIRAVAEAHVEHTQADRRELLARDVLWTLTSTTKPGTPMHAFHVGIVAALTLSQLEALHARFFPNVQLGSAKGGPSAS